MSAPALLAPSAPVPHSDKAQVEGEPYREPGLMADHSAPLIGSRKPGCCGHPYLVWLKGLVSGVISLANYAFIWVIFIRTCIMMDRYEWCRWRYSYRDCSEYEISRNPLSVFMAIFWPWVLIFFAHVGLWCSTCCPCSAGEQSACCAREDARAWWKLRGPFIAPLWILLYPVDYLALRMKTETVATVRRYELILGVIQAPQIVACILLMTNFGYDDDIVVWIAMSLSALHLLIPFLGTCANTCQQLSEAQHDGSTFYGVNNGGYSKPADPVTQV